MLIDSHTLVELCGVEEVGSVAHLRLLIFIFATPLVGNLGFSQHQLTTALNVLIRVLNSFYLNLFFIFQNVDAPFLILLVLRLLNAQLYQILSHNLLRW